MKNSNIRSKLKLPLSFTENKGQEDESVYFTASHQNRRFFFASDHIGAVELEPVELAIGGEEIIYKPEPSKEMRKGISLALFFVGANSGVLPGGFSEAQGKSHYFKGNDPSKWQKDVKSFKGLRYSSVWNGIDLEIYGSSEGLKMNWLLDSPGRLPSLHLRWSGADLLEIDSKKNLLVHHPLGILRDLAPVAYQEINGEKVEVKCSYQLLGGLDVGFVLEGEYEPDVAVTIDPIIQYSTYLGGSSEDFGRRIFVDTQGSAYIVGDTSSPNFPVTPGAFQTSLNGAHNLFVTKFAEDGTLIYSTYLGGSDWDYGGDIFVDLQGCAYVTGSTESPDFPVTAGAFQTVFIGGNQDAFLTKLSPDGGSLIYSTFLGGNGPEEGVSVTADAQNSPYVSGRTGSTNFPITSGAFQPVYGGGPNDAFVTKFTPDGSSLIYSSYLGGTFDESAVSIAVDCEGRAYVTGNTTSPDFPVTPNAFDTSLSGVSDAFVASIAPDGSSLIFSTYLGGSGQEGGFGLALNSVNEIYVTGLTSSNDFPVTPEAFQPTYGGDGDAFITIFSSGGSLISSTYLGGSAQEAGTNIALDKQGHVYITGYTSSPDFPITPEVISSSLSGTFSSFVSVLSEDLSNLIVSYYLGGSGVTQGFGIALGPDGAIYTTGVTNSTDFPVTTGAFQTVYGGGALDAFVTKSAFVFYRQASLVIQGLI